MSTDLSTDLARHDEQQTDLLAQARALVVDSPDSYTLAATILAGAKALHKAVVEHYAPMKHAADAAKKTILASERAELDQLDTVERFLKGKMLSYYNQEERRKGLEQLRLQAEADEAARHERAALEKLAARSKKPETRERYAEQAAAVITPVVSVVSEAPKLSGISTRKTWKARVVHPAIVPRDFLMVDEKKLDAYARAMKDGARVEGVEFYAEESIAVTAR